MGVTAAVKKYFRVGDPLWAVRRRCAVGGLLFSCFMVIDGAHFVKSEAIGQTLITTGSATATLIFTMYLFAATWADKAKEETEK